VSPAKTHEPIEMHAVLRDRIGQTSIGVVHLFMPRHYTGNNAASNRGDHMGVNNLPEVVTPLPGSSAAGSGTHELTIENCR